MAVTIENGKYVWDGFVHGNEPLVPLEQFYAPIDQARGILDKILANGYHIWARVSFGTVFHRVYKIYSNDGPCAGSVFEFDMLDKEDEVQVSYFVGDETCPIEGEHMPDFIDKFIALIKEYNNELC